jgi:hypothetical protein
MRLTASVTVQAAPTTANITYDSEGTMTIAWTASQTVELSNKQPLAGEIVFAEYGISDAGITNLFFFKTNTTAIENGRIVDSDGTYDIYRVDKYSNHYEVIVRPVVS